MSSGPCAQVKGSVRQRGPGAPRAVKCGCHGDLRWRDDAGDAAVGEARLDFRDHHVGQFAQRVGDEVVGDFAGARLGKHCGADLMGESARGVAMNDAGDGALIFHRAGDAALFAERDVRDRAQLKLAAAHRTERTRGRSGRKLAEDVDHLGEASAGGRDHLRTIAKIAGEVVAGAGELRERNGRAQGGQMARRCRKTRGEKYSEPRGKYPRAAG